MSSSISRLWNFYFSIEAQKGIDQSSNNDKDLFCKCILLKKEKSCIITSKYFISKF